MSRNALLRIQRIYRLRRDLLAARLGDLDARAQALRDQREARLEESREALRALREQRLGGRSSREGSEWEAWRLSSESAAKDLEGRLEELARERAGIEARHIRAAQELSALEKLEARRSQARREMEEASEDLIRDDFNGARRAAMQEGHP